MKKNLLMKIKKPILKDQVESQLNQKKSNQLINKIKSQIKYIINQ